MILLASKLQIVLGKLTSTTKADFAKQSLFFSMGKTIERLKLKNGVTSQCQEFKGIVSLTSFHLLPFIHSHQSQTKYDFCVHEHKKSTRIASSISYLAPWSFLPSLQTTFWRERAERISFLWCNCWTLTGQCSCYVQAGSQISHDMLCFLMVGW